MVEHIDTPALSGGARLDRGLSARRGRQERRKIVKRGRCRHGGPERGIPALPGKPIVQYRVFLEGVIQSSFATSICARTQFSHVAFSTVRAMRFAPVMSDLPAGRIQ